MVAHSRVVVLVAALSLGACMDSPSLDAGPEPAADAAVLDAEAEYRIDREAAITCTSTAIDGLFPPECVAPALRVPLPSHAKHVIDLSGATPGSEGTCGPYFANPQLGEGGLLLPADRSLYPLLIRLPAVRGADPACETCSEVLPQQPGPLQERFGEHLGTAFGIALETYDGRGTVQQPTNQHEPKYLAVTVPPPWYLVSGGCGEACAYLCLGGYQEFGIQSCSNIPYGALGFATWDPGAPAAEAVIMLVDIPIPQVDGLAGRQCFFAD